MFGRDKIRYWIRTPEGRAFMIFNSTMMQYILSEVNGVWEPMKSDPQRNKFSIKEDMMLNIQDLDIKIYISKGMFITSA